jgi:GxxExxY protein
MDWEEFRQLRRSDVRREPPEELDRLAHAVIGAAIEVHRILGPGHSEASYEEALCVEMGIRGIPFERQVRYDLQYKGNVVGEGWMDLVVGGELVIELKAIDALVSVHTSQLLSYLRATGRRLGLLINFNVAMLRDGIKRVVVS